MRTASKILFIAAIFSTIILFGFKVQNYGEMKNFLMWKNASGEMKDYLNNDRGLKASTDYFTQKLDMCTKLEALGALDKETPEIYKDILPADVKQECIDFLYN